MPPTSYSITIPTTSTVDHPKPHTIYNITLSLPLQKLTIPKRYSDFQDLHSALVSQAGSAPPAPLPPKTYLPSFLGGGTNNNPALIESRRRALETYLQQIASATTSPIWRETPAWRAFLNLPSGLSSKSSIASTLRTNESLASAPSEAALSADPGLWLDTQREVKILLQEARKLIAARDSTISGSSGTEKYTSPAAGHEESAEAKKLLVRATGMISALERGLKGGSGNNSGGGGGTDNGDEWSRERLGEGEVRRRRDLVAQARREKDDLEALLSMIGRKRDVEAVVSDLTKAGNNSNTAAGGGGSKVSKGRVLGKETARTRELDNSGVLQLQAQMMAEQDEEIDVLTAAVRRQRELATQINEELAVQNDLLGLVEEDVDRVAGKIKVANKRIGKIR